MNSLYTRLDALLRSDAGARGFSANAGAADMDALAKAFAAAKCALIITGFPWRRMMGISAAKLTGR